MPAESIPEPAPQTPEPSTPTPDLQLRLTLTFARPGARAWHARVHLPDQTVRDFSSPFELVRYLAWPELPERRSGRAGLR